MGHKLGRLGAGPYPVATHRHSPTSGFAFPIPANGAHDQTFRMMVRPDVWSRQARCASPMHSAPGPLTLDGVYAGLALGGPALVKGSNRPVTSAANRRSRSRRVLTRGSDAVDLAFVRDTQAPELRRTPNSPSASTSRARAGPMTWHAKALTTSFVTAPNAGAKGAGEEEAAFPYRPHHGSSSMRST